MLDICVSYKCSPSRSSRAMNAHAPRVVPLNTRARKKFKRVRCDGRFGFSSASGCETVYDTCASSNQIVEIKEKRKSKEKEKSCTGYRRQGGVRLEIMIKKINVIEAKTGENNKNKDICEERRDE